MTSTNGFAAEQMLKLVLQELGFKGKCPFTLKQVLDDMNVESNNPHFSSALFHIERQYGDYNNIPVDILMDYSHAIDCWFDNGDMIVSLDITINQTTTSFNHKSTVQHWIQASRKRLGLKNHLIVVVTTTKCYKDLSTEDKWLIIDSISDAINNGKSEVFITV